MWRASCLLNRMLGGDPQEPLCARIERGWYDRRPGLGLLRMVVNIRNPMHSAQVLREFQEMQE